MNDSPHVGVVILNWNGTTDTARCLASIRSSGADRPASVIVIDNGSAVDPTNEIKSADPGATVILLKYNSGFAVGSNIGIKQALKEGADYVVLLNNDTIVDTGLFRTLIVNFAANMAAGAIGPLIYGFDRKQIDFAGAEINFAFGKFRHIHHQPREDSKCLETDYVSGACMMLSRKVLERIGLFDEDLFAYFEDVDLCLRARGAGFQLLCVPGASIVHKGSASTQRTLSEGTTSPLKHYLIARNRTLVVRRYGSNFAKLFYFAIATPVRLAFYTCAFALKFRWKKLRAFWRGTMDGLRNRTGAPPRFLFS